MRGIITTEKSCFEILISVYLLCLVYIILHQSIYIVIQGYLICVLFNGMLAELSAIWEPQSGRKNTRCSYTFTMDPLVLETT